MDPITNDEQLAEFLSKVHGTDEWVLSDVGCYQKHLVSKGVALLCEATNSWWMLSVIGSYQPKLRCEGHVFQTWKLKVDRRLRNARVSCEDGNGRELVAQFIKHTDFPASYVEYYGIWDENIFTVLLPQEY